MMTLLLALDAGTTSVKAGLFEPTGRCLGVGREEYQLSTPSAGRAELDAEIYWQSCIRAVHTVLADSQADPKDIAAVAVSSQGETTIAVDRQGKPLHPAIVWLDNRATDEAADLADRFSTLVYAVTGVPEIVPTWTAAKILWLRKHEPQLLDQTHKFLLVQDFIIHRLSGEFVTDGSVSATTLFYDLRRHAWWPEMLEAAGLPENKLPRILPPSSAIGALTHEAAEALGINRNALVVLGGMDQCTGAIGAGNITPGIVSETTGAALAIQAAVSTPDIDPTRQTPVNLHSVPGMYLFLPFCQTAGMAFKWFRDQFGEAEVRSASQAGADPYDLLTSLASTVPPGSDGLVLLPHLMGAYSPEYNPAARGAFTGFTLGHGKGHFVRAILEGVAFMLRRNIETIQNAGIEVTEVRSGGGGARSPLWNQIKADVLGLPVISLANEETGLLGDAILAGLACGAFPSVEAGCRQMVALGRQALPGPSQAQYEEAYQRYCDLNQVLGGYFQRSFA